MNSELLISKCCVEKGGSKFAKKMRKPAFHLSKISKGVHKLAERLCKTLQRES